MDINEIDTTLCREFDTSSIGYLVIASYRISRLRIRVLMHFVTFVNFVTDIDYDTL